MKAFAVIVLIIAFSGCMSQQSTVIANETQEQGRTVVVADVDDSSEPSFPGEESVPVMEEDMPEPEYGDGEYEMPDPYSLELEDIGNQTLILRIIDYQRGGYVPGVFVSPVEGERTDIKAEGAEIKVGRLIVGTYYVGVEHEGDIVYFPFQVDEEALNVLRNIDEYDFQFYRSEFSNRYFTVSDEDNSRLQGFMALDDVEIGSTDENGWIVVNYTELRPGNLTFAMEGTRRGWVYNYTKVDMQYLYFDIPVKTRPSESEESLGLEPTEAQ